MLEKKDLYALFEKSDNTILKEYNNSKSGFVAKKYSFRSTSGTLGGKPLIRVGAFQKKSYPKFDDKKSSLILMGSPMVKLTNSLIFFNSESSQDASLLVPNQSDLNMHLEDILTDLDVDYILGHPSFIISMLNNIKNKETLSSVKRISLTGELYTEDMKNILPKKIGNAEIVNGYVMSEIGGIGRSCSKQPNGFFHPSKGVTVEIINRDNIGQIMVSKQLSDLLKIEKYLTGDSIRFIKEPCSCGESVTFELVGRIGYDYIKFMGVQLYRAEFERVMSELNEYVKDFRAEISVRKVGNKLFGKLVIKVLPTPMLLLHSKPVDLIKKEFEDNLFLTATKTLGNMIDSKIFLPLDIFLVESDFPSGHKDIKIKFINE